MKYIKSFNETVDKEVLNIEDALLEFKDSGELIDYRVLANLSIEFIYRDDITGIDRVKLHDRIIAKLKKRYTYIWVSRDLLYVSRKSPEIDNCINYKFEDKINKILSNNLYNLKVKSDNDIFYKTYLKNNIIIIEYNEITKILHVSKTKIWDKFDNMLLDYGDVRIIIQNAFNKKFNKDAKICYDGF